MSHLQPECPSSNNFWSAHGAPHTVHLARCTSHVCARACLAKAGQKASSGRWRTSVLGFSAAEAINKYSPFVLLTCNGGEGQFKIELTYNRADTVFVCFRPKIEFYGIRLHESTSLAGKSADSQCFSSEEFLCFSIFYSDVQSVIRGLDNIPDNSVVW